MATDWTNLVFRWLGLAKYSSTLPTVTAGLTENLQIDEHALLRVTDEIPATKYDTGGLETEGVIRSGSGRLIEIVARNDSASARWLHLFDRTTVADNGTAPFFLILVPANG